MDGGDGKGQKEEEEAVAAFRKMLLVCGGGEGTKEWEEWREREGRALLLLLSVRTEGGGETLHRCTMNEIYSR